MAHTRLLGRTVVASLAVGVALSAAGCGNQNTGPGYANGSTGGLGYAHKALTKDQIMPAAAAAAAEAGTAHITLAVNGKTSKGTACSCMKAAGDVEFGTGKPSMALTVWQQHQRVVMRLVGGMVYLQVPGVTPRGKFVPVDPADKSSSLAGTFTEVTKDMDPSAALKNMRSAVQKSERVGKQTMDGVTVEHYETTIETASLLHKQGYAANAGGLPDTIHYDLWLDQKHLIHRLSFKVGRFSYEETMSRWGQPMHIQKPAASQLMTLPGT